MPVITTAQPYPFAFPAERTALIVIDMQRDFLEPGGFGAALGNDVSRLAPAIAPTRALLEAFRTHGLPVIHTREVHRPDLSDCPPAKRDRGGGPLRIGDPGPMGRILVDGEPGAEIIPALAPLPGEVVIDKPGKGAFHATPLGDVLGSLGVTHLILAGVTTEVCVQTTMREANDRGYDCLLASDATESYFPEFKAAALAMIAAQGGIVGWTAPAAAVIAALEAEAADPLVFAGLLASSLAAAPAFEPFRPGVEAAWLYRTPHGGPAAALLRYAPGAAVPRHHHEGHEHILVLSGSQEDGTVTLTSGDMAVNLPGTHHAVRSPTGCLALLIWERAPRLLD